MSAYRALTCLVFFAAQTLPAQQSDPDDLTRAAVRAALADENRRIEAHPRDPNPLVDRAYTLIDAGAGRPAWAAAQQAMAAAPQSSFAHSAAGWVLHHNTIGVDYGKGYDYEGSLAAYRKAIELDPDDLDVRQAFADSLEFNPDGLRYAPDAHLSEAVRALRYIKARQLPVSPHVEDNLLIDLFYAGQYTDIAAELTGPPSPLRDGVVLAAVAASDNPAAAIAFAGRFADDPQRRAAALNFAAEALWNKQLYPQAAALLQAGLQEGGDQSNTLRKIQLFRSLKPFQGDLFPPTDPRSPVQRLVYAALSGTLSESVANADIARFGFADDAAWHAFLDRLRAIAATFQALSVKTGLPALVMRDIAFGSINLLLEPGTGPGARIAVQVAGSAPKHYFVTKDAGAWKLITGDNDDASAGNAALFLAQHGRENEARALLDFERGEVQKGGGDDPLGGSLFARFWSAGQVGDLETAAAALVAVHGTAPALLPELAARADAVHSPDIDLLLATLYLHNGDGPNALKFSERLLTRYPDSPTAVAFTGHSYGLLKQWPDWTALLDRRTAAHPNDTGLLRQEADEAEAEGDSARARTHLRTLLDSGSASAQDYNRYAWLSLFSGTVDAQAVAAAEQANLMTVAASYPVLHTLACLYAVQGRTAEARQFLLQAMSAANLTEPDENVWFGLGLIYEQYGLADAAVDAYKRVQPPASPGLNDTYTLARTHLNALIKH